jgi:hypothetical protein
VTFCEEGYAPPGCVKVLARWDLNKPSDVVAMEHDALGHPPENPVLAQALLAYAKAREPPRQLAAKN